MVTDDVVWRSAVECAALIRHKELSPVELTEAVLARIDAVNPRLNAFCLIAHDVARRLARGHARDVGRDHAEGVEARVERLDAGQQRLGDLDGRELLVTDERGDLER